MVKIENFPLSNPYGIGSSWGLADAAFDQQSASNWRVYYNSASELLVSAAEYKGLDSSSLANVMRLISTNWLNRGIVMVPVSAHSTEVEGKPVWLVHLDWEYESTPVPLRYCHLRHTRNFAFDRNTLELVKWGSCD
jgi:hypothetical protein